jgi:hypothetical protein
LRGRTCAATVGCLLPQVLGVLSPLVGELEEQGATAGIFDGFGGASAVLGVAFVELHSKKCGGGPTYRPAIALPVCRVIWRCGSMPGVGGLYEVLAP